MYPVHHCFSFSPQGEREQLLLTTSCLPYSFHPQRPHLQDFRSLMLKIGLQWGLRIEFRSCNHTLCLGAFLVSFVSQRRVFLWDWCGKSENVRELIRIPSSCKGVTTCCFYDDGCTERGGVLCFSVPTLIALLSSQSVAWSNDLCSLKQWSL